MKIIEITYKNGAPYRYEETVDIKIDFECKDGFFILKLIGKSSSTLFLFSSHSIELVMVKEEDQ